MLAVDDLRFGFASGSGQVILDEVSFALAAGEVVGLAGASGIGKSTLLELICGNLEPLQGSIDWQIGLPSVAYAPQSDVLLDFRTVVENSALLLETNQIEKSVMRERLEFIRTALLQLDLNQYRHSIPPHLSGGMRQRVQVVQALAAPQSLLMLDEPFSEQDLDQQHKLERLVRGCCKARCQAAIVVSHDLSALAALCDRVIFLGRKPATIVKTIEVPPSVRSEGRSSEQFSAFELDLWAQRATVAGL